MSGYGDVRSRSILAVLRWLQSHRSVEIKPGGRHNTKVTCIRNNATYPLPTSHRVINKHIVNDFMQWLVKNEICTKGEFDEKLR